jgi:serine/threonine/tyrosine-interacting protein
MPQLIRVLLSPFTLTRVTGGISSSPAFVIMFVMQHFQISWEDALHYVQNRRYCISPNSGFITQIKVRRSIHPRDRAGEAPPSSRARAYPEIWLLTRCFLCVLRVLFVQEYEPIYKASVAVAQHPAPQIDRSTSRRKRELDDDDEETGRYGALIFKIRARVTQFPCAVRVI